MGGSRKKTKIESSPDSSSYLSSIVRYTKNGLRYVEPYVYEFRTHVKGRWVGMSIFEMCTKEFVAQTREYYIEAIESGRITVNNMKVNTDYILDHNDYIRHVTRCVENPVSGDLIETIFESDELLVVNKPPSIPVHACGGYRQNTLVAILEASNGYSALHPTHRIDRLTSGIVILGKTPSITRAITNSLADVKGESVMKEYLALVSGEVSKSIVVKGFIRCTDFRVGKFAFSEEETKDSKLSETEIFALKYFPERNETLVRCVPVTGRTHQIRLHLQSIGHPIVNDICYGGKYDPSHPYAIPQIPSLQHDTNGEMFCGGIFLHAFRYKINDLELKAPLPKWVPKIDS